MSIGFQRPLSGAISQRRRSAGDIKALTFPFSGGPLAARPLQWMVGPPNKDVPSSSSFTAGLERRGALFENSSQLVAKLGTVVMPVHGHGVLHSSLQEFFFAVGRYGDRAIHFAWEFT